MIVRSAFGTCPFFILLIALTFTFLPNRKISFIPLSGEKGSGTGVVHFVPDADNRRGAITCIAASSYDEGECVFCYVLLLLNLWVVDLFLVAAVYCRILQLKFTCACCSFLSLTQISPPSRRAGDRPREGQYRGVAQTSCPTTSQLWLTPQHPCPCRHLYPHRCQQQEREEEGAEEGQAGGPRGEHRGDAHQHHAALARALRCVLFVIL